MGSTGSLTLAKKGVAAVEVLTTLDGTPSTEEAEVLRNWPGWGPLAPAFDPTPEGAWAGINQRLCDLLTSQEMTTAGEAVDNSFYTSPQVIDTIYHLLREAGFTGGRILEPGCGSGAFLRRVPTEWPVQFVGVERDLISARIATALHPDAEIITSRYEKASPKAGFDAVVGNVPFSKTLVFDKADNLSENLHNYFIIRSLRLLREGGYLVAVTSRYSLDTQQNILTKTHKIADFVGAMRLPTGTFRREGTSVVSDIVVLRKNTTRDREGWSLPGREALDIDSKDDEDPVYSSFRPTRRNHYSTGFGMYRPVPGRRSDEQTDKVHRYWFDHPAHVAGRITQTGNFHNPVSVLTDDIPNAIIGARAALSEQINKTPMFEAGFEFAAEEFEDTEGRKEGSFHLINETMMRVTGGQLTDVPKPTKELAALVTLRDLALRLLEAEADPHAPDESMATLRSETLTAYQQYVSKYGPLNRGTLHEGKVDAETGAPALTWRRPTLGGFRRDPDYVSVMALEHFDQDTGEAEPAAILLRRVNAAPAPAAVADSPAEALAISLGETGRVDLTRVASLLSLPDDAAALAALGDLVFCDPGDHGRITTARDYLCGDVRTKLSTARQAAEDDPQYARNVAALEDVMPADLGPAEIRMNLGNPCLTAGDIGDFLEQVIGRRSRVEHCAVTSTWRVETSAPPPEATTTWGIADMNAYQLVNCALNGKAPVVYDEIFERGKGRRKVRNPEKSLAAQDKMNALHDRFNVWVWEDPDRAARLCHVYNQRFNSYVPRMSDGSHLTFPGMSNVVTPYPWQRNIVDQIVSTPAVLCGHCVGSGKTLGMALAAVTLRRFGLARKPLIVVPNHLLEQIAREMQQAFPLGKFLIASKEDLKGDSRRLFVARCATGDWDAVVMTHQGFTSLPVHPRTEMDWLEAQKAEYDAHLRAETGGYAGAKEIARRVRSLETRLEKVRDNAQTDPDQVLFEHLGIDYLAVDECHMMKRLPVASRSEGFSMGASKRATDLLLKAETIKGRKPGMPYLGLFTGTPWTNTLAETFVWQKFTQPEVLNAAGVGDFDAWASVFVKRETVVEVSPDGSGFRTATRPTKMHNLPELQTMLHQVSDILTADEIGLERPERETESVTVQQTPGQGAYVARLVERAEKLRQSSSSPQKGDDNMLVICGDGRRVALDPRLVGVAEDSPKIAALATRVAQMYRETKDTRYGDSPTTGAFQIVFCDQGTPSKEAGPQTYGRVKDALVREGVPADRVRMIHEARDDKSRAALFAACRDGAVSVLIGSTEKMGTGTNMQTRLGAVHHLDAPWRPSDIEQREGRALRPGNLNRAVRIFRYVTERTFDAFMWQALERKALGFAAMYRRNVDVREVDDIGEVVPDYTQMKALATGSPLLLEQAEVAATVKRLRTLRAVDAQSVVAARKRLKQMGREAESSRARIELVDTLLGSDERDHNPDGVFAHMVRQVRNGSNRDYLHSYGVDWRGLRLSISGYRKEAEMDVKVGYRTLDTLPIPNENVLLRGDLKRAERMLRRLAEEWDNSVDSLVDRLRDRAAYLETEISRSRSVVDNYVFEREDELRAAQDRLDAIEAEIAAQVTEEAEAA